MEAYWSTIFEIQLCFRCVNLYSATQLLFMSSHIVPATKEGCMMTQIMAAQESSAPLKLFIFSALEF